MELLHATSVQSTLSFQCGRPSQVSRKRRTPTLNGHVACASSYQLFCLDKGGIRRQRTMERLRPLNGCCAQMPRHVFTGNRRRPRNCDYTSTGTTGRASFFSPSVDSLRASCSEGQLRPGQAGSHVVVKGMAQAEGNDKEDKESTSGSGSKEGSKESGNTLVDVSSPSVVSENQADVKKDEDDELFDNVQAAYGAFTDGDIGFFEFVRRVAAAFFVDIVNVEAFNAVGWYDVDGKKITDWTKERMETVLLGKAGMFLDYFDLEAGSGAQRVDWMLEKELKKNVFANSPFSVTGVEQELDGSRCFYGELTGDPAYAYEVLNQRLSAQYPELVLILSQEEEYGTPTCSVAYRDTFVVTPGVSVEVSILSLVLVLIWSNSLLRTDPTLITGGAALWNGLLFPLGLLMVMVSSYVGQAVCSLLYKVPPSPFIVPLPAPGFGLVGQTWKDKCLLPNRACLIDQALASSAATFVTSVFLMSYRPPPVPFYLRLLASDFGWTEAPGALKDVVLVSADTFRFSAVMSEFASHLSIATYDMPSGESLMAIGPFALAGLVGLNMTALNLTPFGVMNGGRIIAGIGGVQMLLICSFLTAVAIICLSIADIHSFWPWFGLGIAFVGLSAYEMQRNELSPPGTVRAGVGLGFVGMGAFTLLPISLFYAIFSTGPGILIEQLGAALSLFPIQ